jgi:uncharacterized membrane protein
VPRQEEIQSITAPLTIIILVSFFLSFGALDDPGSTLAKVLSLIALAARAYGAAVLRTGSRVTLRAVWRATGERA